MKRPTRVLDERVVTIGRPRGARDRRGRCMRVELRDVAGMTRKATAAAIARTMRAADVAASELAAACGVTPRTVHWWCAGKVRLSVERLKQIAVALGVPLDHLV